MTYLILLMNRQLLLVTLCFIGHYDKKTLVYLIIQCGIFLSSDFLKKSEGECAVLVFSHITFFDALHSPG